MKSHHRSILVFALFLFVFVSFVMVQSSNLSVRTADAAVILQNDPAGEATEEASNDLVVDPTALPTEAPTLVPTTVPTVVPTEPPTTAPTSVPTTAPTLAPTVEVTAEATGEATTEPTPEATTEVETTATVVPEMTEEATAEATAEATPLVPLLDVLLTCKETGLEFEIVNLGDDMTIPAGYLLTLDESVIPEIEPEATAEPGESEATPVFATEFLLLAGESLKLDGGFGRPALTIGEITYQPELPCEPPLPPVISVSAVCALETGVSFTIANSGGAMTAEQPYSIALRDGSFVAGTFLLATDEEVLVAGGYGLPQLTTGEIISTVETNCDAPATVTGLVWSDADGNGLRDAAESGIAGATVVLTDATGAYQVTTTVSDGSYQFTLLPTGAYSAHVDATTISGDYVLTYPANDSGAVALLAESGGSYTADFGYQAAPSASLSGVVWLETMNYGTRDDGEMGIAGVMVELVNSAGTVVAAAPVNALTGAYQFEAVLAGSYTVRLDQTTLFTPNGVSWNSDDQLDFQTPVTLATADTLTGIDFGIVGTF